MSQYPPGVVLLPTPTKASNALLSFGALEFIAHLHRTFNRKRAQILFSRTLLSERIRNNELNEELIGNESVRSSQWSVAPVPESLQRRHVEITGPTSPAKMVVNALNSGADCWMADFEDALSPSWERIVDGHTNMVSALNQQLEFTSPEGKHYALKAESKTIPLVRPRGWHMLEKHILIDGQPISASLFDFGIYFYHNAQISLQRQMGPYFYLPKLESSDEARLWSNVFSEAEDRLPIPKGSIRATILIETITAALQMDEILYELRNYCCGLNAGRWDYIFSVIKKFGYDSKALLPDRTAVTMRTPFMRAYAQLLVKTCHRRQAHAIGGMAAFIPTANPEINKVAMSRVQEDKQLELESGYDGTWVAHPGLIKPTAELFENYLKGRPHQKEDLRLDLEVNQAHLLDFQSAKNQITLQGIETNIKAAVLYMDAWLGGNGAVAINNLMEDAATAEISRTQLWQWIHHKAKTNTGQVITAELYQEIRDKQNFQNRKAVEIVDSLVLRDSLLDFMTIPAYEVLCPVFTGAQS